MCHIAETPRFCHLSILTFESSFSFISNVSSNLTLSTAKKTTGSNPLTDSMVRKTLKILNANLGFHPSFFTCHDFRRSGATFAYNSHIPIKDIKRHGTWSSDCIWQYIHSDHASGESIACALASTIVNAL